MSTTGTNSYGSNFYELLPHPINTKQYDVRLDHTFSDKDSAFLTWSKYNQTNQEQPPYAGPLEGGSSVAFWSTNPTYMVVLTETHVFNPNLINEYRMSDEHNWNTRMDPGTSTTRSALPRNYGIPGIPQTQTTAAFRPLTSAAASPAFGSRTNVTWQKVGAWQFSDNLTKIVGKNEWKFGAEYWWTYGNIAQLPYSRGNFSYGQYSNVPASGDGGPGMADFLLTPTAWRLAYATAYRSSTAAAPLGGVTAITATTGTNRSITRPISHSTRSTVGSSHPTLTANLGIRDDYFGPYYSAGGTQAKATSGWAAMATWPAAAPITLTRPAAPRPRPPTSRRCWLPITSRSFAQPNNAVNKTPKFNWAPRLGFAYRVRPNLVVRAGGGVSYGAFNSVGYGGTLGTNYPFRVSVQQGPRTRTGRSMPPTAALRQRWDHGEYVWHIDMTSALNAYQPFGSVVFTASRTTSTYRTRLLNAAVQWQFTSHDSVEVRYVGVLGKQLESANPYHNAARQALPRA